MDSVLLNTSYNYYDCIYYWTDNRHIIRRRADVLRGRREKRMKQMNSGTKLRTLLAIATSLNTALMATDLTGFNNGTVDAVYKIASIILNFIIVSCVTYYNNDYTEVACVQTGEMRARKAEAKGNVKGEYFFTEGGNDEQ